MGGDWVLRKSNASRGAQKEWKGACRLWRKSVAHGIWTLFHRGRPSDFFFRDRGVRWLRVMWLSIALCLPAVSSPLLHAEIRLARPPSAVSLLPSPTESAVVCRAAAWTSTVVGRQPVVSKDRKGYLQNCSVTRNYKTILLLFVPLCCCRSSKKCNISLVIWTSDAPSALLENITSRRLWPWTLSRYSYEIQCFRGSGVTPCLVNVI